MSTSNPVSDYAEKVCSGELIAGPHVRNSCKRHLDDMDKGHERGIYFDDDACSKAIGYYRDVLKLNGGDFEGVPFELLDWQVFIVGSLFGWMGSDGYRRFRVCFVETGKGSGKSPLAAGVGLYGMTADKESRAEIYAAATKKDQAMILFRDAVAMVQQSESLTKRIKTSGTGQNIWNLAYLKNGSFFRPISSDDGASGPRPHVALLDEIHEHKNAQIVEFMRAGTKGRRQAIIFMITNSGSNKQSVCWEYHEYARKIASRALEDDSFFSYVCGLDEGDDPFQDESCWGKSNPSLGVTIPLKYLQEQVREARGMPSKEATVRRLNFCEWTDAQNPWISYDVWLSCKDEEEIDLTDRRCWGGLDLSSTTDLTALALVFEPTTYDDKWRLKVWFWLPADDLERKGQKDGVPYLVWRERGFLDTTDGKAINKLAILAKLSELSSKYEIESIAYDRWRIEDLKVLIDQEGYTLPEMVPFGQGYKDMAPALQALEADLIDNNMSHDGNPVLTWNAANAVAVEDHAGNKKLAKDKSTGRIDGMVSAVMARGLSMTGEDRSHAYEDRGFITL
jgi:phage terminase large subunit-like protein